MRELGLLLFAALLVAVAIWLCGTQPMPPAAVEQIKSKAASTIGR